MAIGIFIIGQPAADVMSGMNLGQPLTMGMLQGCAPWRTLLKLPAIFTGDSLARWRNLLTVFLVMFPSS